MATLPTQLFLTMLLGLASTAILAAALGLLYGAHRTRRPVRVHPLAATEGERVEGRRHDMNRPVNRGKWLMTAIALAMLLCVFAGRYLVRSFVALGGEHAALPTGTASHIKGASGADLAVVQYGPADGPTLLFTHGWGADRKDWAYAISALPPGYRVVAWDLPGLGESTPTRNYNYSMRTLAADLDSVVSSIGGGPVILVGHSIGGILNLEYARRYPAKMGRDVSGLVQANTTFTNPVQTKKGAETSRKLQRPVYEPLLHVIAWTSPVARALGWMAYQSGLAHLQLASQSFAGAETWDQLDEMAKYAYRSSPGIVARGVLGMLHWDASDVLPRINVPTLVISGDADTTTLPDASDRMARDIRSSTRLSVADAAHLGPVEQHRKYAHAIGAFAQTVFSATGTTSPGMIENGDAESRSHTLRSSGRRQAEKGQRLQADQR